VAVVPNWPAEFKGPSRPLSSTEAFHSTPGPGAVQIVQGGVTGFVKAIAPISNVDSGGMERADAHGIALRRK
jgi:hypothetical protein